jgi:ribosomal protein S18 acetylase RimI-like enzyme
MTTTILTAHRQYASRPADERFDSLDALIAHSLDDKNLSAERTYNLKDLQVAPTSDGDLQLVSPRGAAAFTHWSFGQLARTVGAPAGYLREQLSPELAAACLNHGLTSSPVGTSANLLVRGANGAPPIVRACTSESYGRVWDAELLSGARNSVFAHASAGSGHEWQTPRAWSGENAGLYRGDRDSFVIQIDGGSIVTDPSAGQDGRLSRGIMIRNSEVGASSIVIECVLFRYICGNLMIWGATIDRQFRRRHVGTRVLRDVLRELHTIAYRWTHRSAAQDEAIIRSLIDHELASTREAVIDELRAIGATREQATHAYETAEKTEQAGPRSFWGIAQGLTRDSQQAEYQDDRYALDKLAGLVLARGAKVAA